MPEAGATASPSHGAAAVDLDRFAPVRDHEGWALELPFGNFHSGGFHVRGRADCAPLLVASGGLSSMIRVGLGRACGIPH